MRTAIGVDLGATKTAVALISSEGAIVERRSAPTDTSTAESVLDALVALVRSLRDHEGVAVGVGAPGTIVLPAGELVQAANLPIANFPVRAYLSERLGVDVALDNDGTCAALGEHLFGAGRGHTCLVALTLGTGVGGGMIEAGRPIRGSGGAGELGHIVVDYDGRPCQGSCPGRGHLEGYASGPAIALMAQEHAAASPNGTFARARRDGRAIDSRLVVELARAGDPDAGAVLAEASKALGYGLVTIANAFAPEVIAIGGGLGVGAYDLIVPPAAAILRREGFEPMRDALVTPAKLGSDAGLLGAAALTWTG